MQWNENQCSSLNKTSLVYIWDLWKAARVFSYVPHLINLDMAPSTHLSLQHDTFFTSAWSWTVLDLSLASLVAQVIPRTSADVKLLSLFQDHIGNPEVSSTSNPHTLSRLYSSIFSNAYNNLLQLLRDVGHVFTHCPKCISGRILMPDTLH